MDFKAQIRQGIPAELPAIRPFKQAINFAPKRVDILSKEEKKLALKNALRYFSPKHHKILAPEFLQELNERGRIYMYRFKPNYEIKARSIDDYPYKSRQAAAIMLMISNNLDEAVAQHPYELITYGGNGAVFQNWAQYLLTMKYLSEMTDEQTLVLYSGHPLGLFPSNKEAPRVIITNGMVIPNYSSKEDYERMNALGVTQYGQMTAGSFMYIGPQGIVHGTTITVLNAGRKLNVSQRSQSSNMPAGQCPNFLAGRIFVTSGLGGMSGAQPKATVIAGAICVVAEINPKAIEKRFSQGWVDEVYTDLDKIINRMLQAQCNKETVSLAYQGNIVDLWEKLADNNIKIDLGSDQTSLHNPYSGGYYPVGLSFDDANKMMADEPTLFKIKVKESLIRQVKAINKLAALGMYFWDYGNAFLLEAGRAGADIFVSQNSGLKSMSQNYKYNSYVQDIMGPMFFDYGFGPFRWVCTSNKPEDLEKTDKIAADVLEEILKTAPAEIKTQLEDNIHWIKAAAANKLVVGSQARILYADCEGRIKIAAAFNKAIRDAVISAPVVLGRDHHDVSGTDSPFRETSNIYDGSQFTADMAVHNVIGDAVRGATWVSIHNGGGVGWGEVINGGFGLVLDGSEAVDRRLNSMLFWDVNNGIARRAWAGNKEALFTIKRASNNNIETNLSFTLPYQADDDFLNSVFS